MLAQVTERQLRAEMRQQQADFFQQAVVSQKAQDEAHVDMAKKLAEARTEAAREVKEKLERKMREQNQPPQPTPF